MLISDFDFQLPEHLIAQTPLENRAGSRMLMVDREKQIWRDEHFHSLADFMDPTDVLVLNNTKVFPARLFGQTETGAKVEIFLVKENEDKSWEALARPARRLKTGKRIIFGEKLSANVLDRNDEGKVFIEFEANGNLEQLLDELGKTPLPPYIKRDTGQIGDIDGDRERYQTVFARERGAIAAPTAGLHFTPEIISQIKARGVTVAEITLHVGYGTFEPVRSRDISHHRVSAERCEISTETARVLNEAKDAGRKMLAVGTTTTRALESFANENGVLRSGAHPADITITPGYKFRFVDKLLTNFHLPRSSLLVLVSAFAGREFILSAYEHAVAENYRFYSYGDCMLIE
ncbi:MAG TPA: tRNA preQ1(34) S-adenosylmethionine ribosyltransferase-isomerase QueA [Pyrinomonadaceae bacterium]|jgi:S-adenosylmethionine:tRNA ribosyltransferase-isomerase|nr:tRNA preQ1(34) S-adenosylmethionine ribosyltransferase-isomerase QueA [Pyrinomonadaceae bacterium]